MKAKDNKGQRHKILECVINPQLTWKDQKKVYQFLHMSFDLSFIGCYNPII